MKKIISIVFLLTFSSQVFAGGGGELLLKKHWSFEGVFGKFDKVSVQRGYQVYKEVCASCHSLKRVYYRNLMEIGFSENEAKAIAAEATVIDGPDESGDMFERPARLSDKFVSPFANENAARASNGGAYPPDLSLIIKARPDGANYVYSLLNGYKKPHRGMKMAPGMHYNLYFPGKQIAMANPLSDGLIDYIDGTQPSAEQMATDVVNFLQWTSEPELEQRNAMGIKVLIYLVIFTILFYIAKRRIWKRVE
jgi:ubiquinol-cytochrome c reductase cytochrome c1 subunit